MITKASMAFILKVIEMAGHRNCDWQIRTFERMVERGWQGRDKRANQGSSNLLAENVSRTDNGNSSPDKNMSQECLNMQKRSVTEKSDSAVCMRSEGGGLASKTLLRSHLHSQEGLLGFQPFQPTPPKFKSSFLLLLI